MGNTQYLAVMGYVDDIARRVTEGTCSKPLAEDLLEDVADWYYEDIAYITILNAYHTSIRRIGGRPLQERKGR